MDEMKDYPTPFNQIYFKSKLIQNYKVTIKSLNIISLINVSNNNTDMKSKYRHRYLHSHCNC